MEVGDLPAQILRYNGDMLAPSLCEPQEWTANSGVAAACADTTAGLLGSRLMNESVLHARA